MAKIIISYRRSDSDVFAGRVRDRIAGQYGDDSVFIDVDNIPFGKDFRVHIQEALSEADAILVIIGPKWLGTGKGDQSRIKDDTDPVRIEVETALSKGIPTIPILIGNTSMPKPGQLPENIRTLAFINAAPVDTGRDFHRDLNRVIVTINKILERSTDATEGAALSTDSISEVEQISIKGLQAERKSEGTKSIRREHEAQTKTTAAESQPSKRVLVIGSLIAAAILASVGVWFFVARSTSLFTSFTSTSQQVPSAPMTSTTPTPAAPAQAPAPMTPTPPVVVPTRPAVAPGPIVGAALSSEQERTLKPKDRFKECATCPEMVVVPGGTFTMGSPAYEAERRTNEGPQHTVTFGKMLAVGRFAVTFDEWDACVAAGGCNGYRPADAGWGRGQRPVINVDWDDAVDYAAWVSKRTGKPYRLLSEAEREYVMRAGVITAYSFGDDASALDQYAWYARNANGQTHPVGEKKVSAFALYDMQGNVWEWTEDCVNTSYDGAPTDGSAWTVGDCNHRILRGGSWFAQAEGLRSARRGWGASSGRVNNFGFRLGRTLSTTPGTIVPSGAR